MNYGAVTELRHGLKAWIKLILPYRLGANRIWSVQAEAKASPKEKSRTLLGKDKASYATLLIISFPLHTEVIQISEDMQAEQRSEADTRGLNLGTRTLAVGRFESSIVQVTPKSISTMKLLPSGSMKPLETSWALPEAETIVEACLQLDSASIVTAVREQDQVRLVLTRIRTENRYGLDI